MVLRSEWEDGTVALTRARERGDICRKYQRSLQVTSNLVSRLGLEKELTGHFGCVNCLEWNTDGSLLASASDDLRVILWDPYRHKAIRTFSTGHTGNIFSVKFVSPYILATCAADSTVRVRDITGGSSPDGDVISVCSCHCSRVKRLATHPECPNLVWSAAEDGFILQHDLRTSHTCNDSSSNNVLINLLNHLGRFAEAKCLAINPRRPEQLAVGANDFYVRLYDRRMIKLSNLQYTSSENNPPRRDEGRLTVRINRAGQGDLENNIPRGCVQYFAPGHLSSQQPESALQKRATTYLTFSADGNELLVNLGSDQVYLFDINSHRMPVLLESFVIQHNHHNKKISSANGTNGFSTPDTMDTTHLPEESEMNGTISADADQAKEYVLPKRVKDLKEQANDEIRKDNYTLAVQLYNEAIALCSDCALLYSNRAAALMRRKWAGDVYAAIRDCYAAISHDPLHMKSHFRLAKALMELNKAREAHECLVYFKDKFPRQNSSHAVWLLQKDINLAMNKLEKRTTDGEPDENTPYAPISFLERQLRGSCVDYRHRFLGHCNTTTDIKEANFLGQDGQFIIAGSDDGSFFIWSRKTGNIVRCMRGDESIVNCIQVHPTMCLIATSGIESTVRLWSPRPEDGVADPREVNDLPDVAQANQQRMRADPFEAMLLNITYQSSSGAGGRGAREGGPGARAGSQGSPEEGAVTCRPS